MFASSLVDIVDLIPFLLYFDTSLARALVRLNLCLRCSWRPPAWYFNHRTAGCGQIK